MAMTPEIFSSHYPRLYHMAEINTWQSICRLGLLSTTAILDLVEMDAVQRKAIESKRRAEIITINHNEYGVFRIRDNKPLTESKLRDCLRGYTPRQWLEELNRKVFFWTTHDRLMTLLNARAYRDRIHTVITLDSSLLLRYYKAHVLLSHINTGALPYGGSPRGIGTFCIFDEWPTKVGPRSGRLSKPVVELAVEDKVDNIRNYTINVKEMMGHETVRTIWER